MLEGSCHCGAVAFTFDGAPESATACNCSVCRRLGAVWIYGDAAKIRFVAGHAATLAYAWGDKNIAFHSCATCGCTTHWSNLTNPEGRMAVNLRLCAPQDVAGIKVRPFDGADTWRFLDEEAAASD